MNKDKTFNTSDSITFNLKESNSELYKEIQERAVEARKCFDEQGLEVVESDDIDFSTNPSETTTYIISMDKETGEFHYYKDDSDDN